MHDMHAFPPVPHCMADSEAKGTHCPETLRIVLASRRDLQLGLHKLRLEGDEYVLNAQFDVAVVFVQEFMCEQRGADAWVEESEQLEQGAVGSDEIYGQDRGGGDPYQTRDAAIPFRISDGPLLKIEVRDFASREYSEQTALFEPHDGVFQSALIGSESALAAKGIYKNTILSRFRQA